MRRFAFAALLAAPLALAAVAAPAVAQDGAAPFTGVHVEGLAGWDDIRNHGHSNDFMYGVAGGYDVALGNGIRVGIDGEVSDSDNKSCFGAKTAADPRLCAKAGRDLYVGGRVGKVVAGGRGLLYASAGYTNARMKITENDGDGQFTLDHTNLDGVRLGVGGEYSLTRNTFLKAEYRYSNYEQGFSRNQLVGGFGVRF
jgi:outer membrane immunogenic protein